MNESWLALAREASLAAELLAIGVTSLGKANYAQNTYYGQAFFALTAGFERASKLILIVDYTLENNGNFPENNVVRRYGHNLSKLLNKVNEISVCRRLNLRLPNTDIHKGIIKVLTDFANNITRYYNLDFITGKINPKTQQDPIKAWFNQWLFLFSINI